jgi:two-component system response regulator DesR
VVSKISNLPITRASGSIDNAEHKLRLVLAVPRLLDYAALSSLLGGISGVKLVAAELELDAVVEQCKVTQPDAAIFDVSYPNGAAFTAAEWLLASGCLTAVAFLDDRFAIWRAQRALQIQNTFYFTRNADIRHICNELRQTGISKTKIHAAIRLSPSGSLFQSLTSLQRLDAHGMLGLSRQERAVTTLLAQGHSIAEIGNKLRLAESTVENHKTRAMKKVKAHRAADLCRIAIETGMVDLPEA